MLNVCFGYVFLLLLSKLLNHYDDDDDEEEEQLILVFSIYSSFNPLVSYIAHSFALAAHLLVILGSIQPTSRSLNLAASVPRLASIPTP